MTIASQRLVNELAGTRTRFAEHACIFQEGDPADRIFQVTAGALMLYKLLPDGRRQVVELLGPGDAFGFSSRPVYDCSAESLTPVTAIAFCSASIERSPELLQRLARCMYAQVTMLHENAMWLGRKSALERLASFLTRYVPQPNETGSMESRARGESIKIRLSMNRQEIADYLGLTIETVSRAFSELKRRRVISIERHDEVLINNVQKMALLSGARETRVV